MAAGGWSLLGYLVYPCREEIPELNRLAEQECITVLGLLMPSKANIIADSVELGIEFPTIDDPSDVLGIARPDKLPTTLVIDPDDNIVSTLVGPQTEESLAKIIENFRQKIADPLVGE